MENPITIKDLVTGVDIEKKEDGSVEFVLSFKETQTEGECNTIKEFLFDLIEKHDLDKAELEVTND